MNWQKLYNPFIVALLKSPLHGFISGSTMLITVTGRKSGRQITLPVGFMRQDDGLLVLSKADRTWWKNLRGGAPVHLRLEGKPVTGTGTAIEDRDGVTQGLMAFARENATYRQVLGIELDEEGSITNTDVLDRLVAQQVIIAIRDLV